MRVKIRVCGGKGGDGCVSFHHRRGKPKGGPDGGNGGDGGSVKIICDGNLSTLSHLNSKVIYRAENGLPGNSNGKKGRRGHDLVLKVPAGTEIYEEKRLIAKMKEGANNELLIAKGGRGGRGNKALRSATNRLPISAEPGKQGERRDLTLEFHIMLDIAIIGCTNCGKSLFLKRLTGANPRVSSRPFTTKGLNLGVIKDEYRRFVIGELPSARLDSHIEHLQDSKMIILLIDGSSDWQEAYYELVAFLDDNRLSDKERIVVINKVDMIFPPYPEINGEECYHISALNGEGIGKIKERIIR